MRYPVLMSKYLTFWIIVRLGASRSTSNLPRRTDRRTRRFLEAKAGILYRDVGVVAGAQGREEQPRLLVGVAVFF